MTEAASSTPDRELADTEAVGHGVPSDAPARLGRYVLLDRLGAGAMGVVFAAFDPKLERKIAIKLVRPERGSPEARARLLREAKALAKLQHPNVVAVHDVGEIGDQVFIAMEFVRGKTLTSWLKTRRSWRDVVAMFVPIALGLQAAHEVGLVHRDFKPDNVLIGEDGRPRVADFGIARAPKQPSLSASLQGLADESDGVTLTRTGAIVGTPAYASAEQFRGEVVTAVSDQFSFCVALFEALFGQRPFKGANLLELMANVTSGRLAEPTATGVPSRLATVVLRGLQLDPADRWPSLQALVTALEATMQRRTRMAALASVGGVAVVAAGGWGWVQLDRAMRQQSCEDAGATISDIWNDDVRAEIGDAVWSTGRAFGSNTWARVVPRVDDYAAKWSEARTEACRLTEVAAVRSAETMQRSVGCLGLARVQLRDLLALVATAEGPVLQNVAWAANDLPDVAACLDESALDRELVPPASFESEVAAAQAELAGVNVVYSLGKYAEAEAKARHALAAAEATEWQPTIAEAHLALATTARFADHPELAIDEIQLAFDVALRSGRDDVALRAATDACSWTTADLERAGEGDRWCRIGDALLDRTGVRGSAQDGALMQAAAMVRIKEGKLDEAIDLLERSVAIMNSTLGESSRGRLGSMETLAGTYERAGRFGEALDLMEEVVAGFETAVGDHPDTGMVLAQLCAFEERRGMVERAEQHCRRSIEILEATLGPDHRDLAAALGKLGRVHVSRGNARAAVSIYERALKIVGEKPARQEVRLILIEDMAVALRDAGELARAAELLHEAIRSRENAEAKDDTFIASDLYRLAETERRIGELDDAAAHFEKAIELFEKVYSGPDGLWLALSQSRLGWIRLKQGRHAEARQVLERAAPLLARQPDHMEDLVAALTGLDEARGVLGLRDDTAVLEQSLRLADEVPGQVEARSRVLVALARIENARGKPGEARARLAAADELLGTAEQTPTVKELRQATARLTALPDEKEDRR